MADFQFLFTAPLYCDSKDGSGKINPQGIHYIKLVFFHFETEDLYTLPL